MSSRPGPSLVPSRTGGISLDGYSAHLSSGGSFTETRYRDFRIRSAFQPIFSFAHGRPVGYEALARAWDEPGQPIPPGTLLGIDRTTEAVVFLDRLLRVLHLENFSRRPADETWLFLNVSPEVVVHGRTYGPFFKEALQRFHLPPQRVVIEVTEGASPDDHDLESAVRYYREIGCLVAIDDFGAGHSNLDRIWQLRPDIVKLDRVLIARAARDPVARRCLIGIAALLHEMGTLVVAEGVETEAEALVCLEAEVDLLQGFLFGAPSVDIGKSWGDPGRFDSLREALRQGREEHQELTESLRAYLEAFGSAAAALGAGAPVEAAVQGLLALPQVMRCYLLEISGRQLGENLTSPAYDRRRDVRHLPLGRASGANWTHRHYFRRAIAHPGQIQISRPYLSLTDPQLCLTLSRVVARQTDRVVLCCDLEYPFPSPGRRDEGALPDPGTGRR